MDKNSAKTGQGCQRMTPVIIWHPWEHLEGLFGTWQSICAISETNGTDRPRWAQMDKNSAKTGQGCQRMTPVIIWHPWEHLEGVVGTVHQTKTIRRRGKSITKTTSLQISRRWKSITKKKGQTSWRRGQGGGGGAGIIAKKQATPTDLN